MVQVRYVGLLHNVLGRAGEDVDLPLGATVGTLFDALGDKYGEEFRSCVMTSDGQLRTNAGVFLGDRNISEMEGMATRLASDCPVDIVVVVYGFHGG